MFINSCPPIFSKIRSVITSIGSSSLLNSTVSIGAVLTGGLPTIGPSSVGM